MKRIECGISVNYVPDWTVIDALREIFQNGLDEEAQHPDNKMHHSYENGTLRVWNEGSHLSTSSLLLGSSTKRGDERCIGYHGEGYKVAMIVFLRNGCGFRILNYVDKEVWTAKIIKSRRFDGADLAVIDIDKMGFFKEAPEQNLIFEITNVSEDDFNQFEGLCLPLRDDIGEVVQGKEGRILLDNNFAGMVFVRGLYVCTKTQLTYGYDLGPSLVKLDRDRGLIDSFNLQFSTSKVIASLDDRGFVNEAMYTWDGKYVSLYLGGYIADQYDLAYDSFVKKFGENAVPCCNNEELNIARLNGRIGVIVNDSVRDMVTRSDKFNKSLSPNISSQLQMWLELTKEYLPEALYEKGKILIENAVQRMY